ncbi:unnamed protein product [Camellia sinensis]
MDGAMLRWYRQCRRNNCLDKDRSGFTLWETGYEVDLQKGRLDLKEEQNRSQVIVVDQNGKGDSVTLQGAVDMVPLLNSQRVKIYIHPGIYRSASITIESDFFCATGITFENSV